MLNDCNIINSTIIINLEHNITTLPQTHPSYRKHCSSLIMAPVNIIELSCEDRRTSTLLLSGANFRASGLSTPCPSRCVVMGHWEILVPTYRQYYRAAAVWCSGDDMLLIGNSQNSTVFYYTGRDCDALLKETRFSRAPTKYIEGSSIINHFTTMIGHCVIRWWGVLWTPSGILWNLLSYSFTNYIWNNPI